MTTLELCRSKRANAIDEVLVETLSKAIEDVVSDPPNVLVITSGVRVFCAGFDLQASAGLNSEVLAARFVGIELLLARLLEVPCLTAALINGPAVGAGADLATVCDFRVGLPAASFSFPGWQFGLALGTRRLVSRVGRSTALDLLIGGRVLHAESALDAGLLTHLVSDGKAADLVISELAMSVAALDIDALLQLLSLTRIRATSSDLGELVESTSRGSLERRLSRFRGAR